MRQRTDRVAVTGPDLPLLCDGRHVVSMTGISIFRGASGERRHVCRTARRSAYHRPQRRQFTQAALEHMLFYVSEGGGDAVLRKVPGVRGNHIDCSLVCCAVWLPQLRMLCTQCILGPFSIDALVLHVDRSGCMSMNMDGSMHL